MSIEIRHITKKFGKTIALDDVNIIFEHGGICGLFGSNGAGKTTLFNIISNRIFPSDGEVLIDGEPVRNNDHALGKLFMLSDANLYPDDMRVNKAFRTASAFYPEFDPDGAVNLAKRFGLNPHKKVASLSTGDSSVFKIAMALSVNVPYLLLDEPVLGLDAQNRDLFYRLLIEKHHSRPFTVIISTHLIQEVSAMINQTVIIRNGRLLINQHRDDLLRSGIDLQDYFIQLMNEEESK